MSNGGVFIRSAGQVTAAGTGVRQLVARLADPGWFPELGLARPDANPLPVATCLTFTTQGVLPPLVARRLDRPARLLAVAAREALGASGETLPWPRGRIGVSAATGNAGTEALFQVLRTVFLVGPEEAPPMQFPSTVANAPASQLAILEKLAGPNVTFAEKQVGGLRALVEADRLIRRGRADAVVAAAVDEAQWLNAESYDRLGALRRLGRDGFVLGEGAAALLVTGEHPGVPCARLAGWGASSSPTTTYSYPTEPGALTRAIEAALHRAGLAADDIELVMSMANGAPVLDRLETASLAQIFARHRPAALVITDRLGEGSFAGLLRVLVATLALTGEVAPAWTLPSHLAAAGFALPQGAPRTALIAGVAGGGSAVAVVLRTS
jgi:3-oxoacyl-[acyl-carrier-protein] synthase II